jgi:WD40 repeat protein
VTPPRLSRWPIALLSLAWSLLLPVSAPAERPDVFWMRGGHAHSATAVAYSPDGSIVASGGDDGAIKLWRGVDGMLLRTLTGHQAPPPGNSAPAMIQSLSFSPDGTLLASAGNDNAVIVWRRADGSVFRTMAGACVSWVGHPVPCGVAFSPNGQMLGVGMTDGGPAGLRIWRVADWTTLFDSPAYGPFSFSPDPATPDRVATMSHNGLQIIRIPDGAVLLDVNAGGIPLTPAFSPDAQLLATRNGRVFSAVDGTLVASLNASSLILGGFGFSPDGQTLAFSGLEGDPPPAFTLHSVIKLFRRADLATPSPAPAVVWSPHAGGQAVIAFSPDGQTLVSAGARYNLQPNYILSLRLWNVADGTLLGTLTAYSGVVWKVALSPDALTVTAATETLTGQTDPLGTNALKFWDAETGALDLTIPDLGQSAVMFSPDGQTLLSAGRCCAWTLAARSPADGSLLPVPSGNPVPGRPSMAFMADGQTVASYTTDFSNNSIQLWSLSDGSFALLTQGPTTGSQILAASADGVRLAAVIADGKQVQIWDTINRIPVTTLPYGQFVTALAFSPDGETLAAGVKPSQTSGAGASIVSLRVADGTAVGIPLVGHTDTVVTLAFSPDGGALVSGSNDATIRFWNTADGSVLKILDEETGLTPGRTLQGVRSIVFSLAGDAIVYGRGDATIVVARNPLIPRVFTLSVSRAGTGDGAVTSAPLGIACGTSCAAQFLEGTVVTLTPVPAAGSYFAGWSGNPACATGAEAMLGDHACTAIFNLRLAQTITFGVLPDKTLGDPPFSVSATAASGLPVSFSAAGSCMVAGATVTLTAAGTCTVTASQAGNAIYRAAPDVPRSFTVAIPAYTLTVSLAGVGAGSVSSAPAGITCPTACAAAFVSGTAVTLTAAPAAGALFRGWSGACTGATCTVTMTAAQAVVATFAPNKADLVEASVSDPPTATAPGGTFGVTDTVLNQGGVSAATSTTRYYLSLDTVKDGADRLLTGTRAVPALAASGTSTSTVTVTIPSNMALGTHFLIACADDLTHVAESDETNNCLASAATIQVTRPDLVETALSAPPATIARGASFPVTDTVLNQGAVAAGASTTRYYFSANQAKDGNDRLLGGSRSVPALGPSATFTGTASVTVPSNMALGTYYLIACADNTTNVTESDETNNCLVSAPTVQVTVP